MHICRTCISSGKCNSEAEANKNGMPVENCGDYKLDLTPECGCCGVLIKDKEDYNCWLRHGWCQKCQVDFGEEDMENPLGVIERDEIEPERFEESKTQAGMSRRPRYRG